MSNKTLTLPKNRVEEVAEEPGKQVGGGSTFGTGNDDMIARRNAIADSADAGREGELEDIGEEVAQNSQVDGGGEGNPPDDTQVSAAGEDTSDKTRTPASDHPDLSRAVTRKVNGKDVTKTLEEWLIAAQKVESADEYLRSSSEAVRNAAELALSGETDEPTQDEIEEARAQARALQMGNEDEAVQVLLKLKKPQPSATPDVEALVEKKLSARDAVKAKAEFELENKDLFADDMLKALVFEEDKKLHAANPDMPYLERWQKSAEKVRTWAKSSNLLQSDKAARKALVSAPKPAAGRQQQAEDQEPSDDPRDVIAQMAAKRGQSATAH